MKTKFQGIPLIEISENIPSYNFLQGEFGKEFLKEYNKLIKSDYKNNSNLKILNFKENIVKGSNIYSVFLANDILSLCRLRTATPADIQKIIDKDKNFLSHFYVDLGIVLRTENNPNEYLAKQLGKQAKERGYKFSNKSPLVFKTSDLGLILDNNSNSGLGFKIKESASPINVLQFDNKNNNKIFNQTENGYPILIFDKYKDRTLYTIDEGLSGFLLGSNSYLDSGNGGLAVSASIGRIVVVNK